jgi:hypothetical protein
MAVREWPLMQNFYLYGDGTFKLSPKWVKFPKAIGDCAANGNILVE